MSVEEVQAAVPEARPSRNYDRLSDGTPALLTVENIELVNRRFDAKFYFAQRKLRQVMLSLTDKPQSAHQGKLIYDSLRTALRAKYGREIDTAGVRNSVGALMNPTWMSGATNIELVYLAIGNEFLALNVVYQTSVSKETAKL